MSKNQRYRPSGTIKGDDSGVIDEIFDILNDLAQSVNKRASGASSLTDLSGGDIQIVKDSAEGKSYVQFNDGEKTLRIEGAEFERKRTQ